MHAHTDYTIQIHGDDAAVQAIGAVLTATITDVEFDVEPTTIIEETYDCVFEDEVVALAQAMAKAAPQASFVMTGIIDTSESAGEYMDFRIELAGGKLTAAFSDWYLSDWMGNFEDYEDFCDCVMECTEEEYEVYCGYEFLFTLETDEGNVYTDHVPLHDPVEIAF